MNSARQRSASCSASVSRADFVRAGAPVLDDGLAQQLGDLERGEALVGELDELGTQLLQRVRFALEL